MSTPEQSRTRGEVIVALLLCNRLLKIVCENDFCNRVLDTCEILDELIEVVKVWDRPVVTPEWIATGIVSKHSVLIKENKKNNNNLNPTNL